ncbi:hypothetical protein [Kineosporia sp. NBRC 101731]|uniref:hypothetical protein n=1 Tax=Kineosporia sp. NBRC 101731 TaxID=3032199 RepID=UPI0024A37344|nr:hypothetical protein [Kineosporia sp. NBRC 101731]GLY32630.1 hypothetical protein Kisp02_59950 [Kineosporia sp. NBRC 101731]
MTVTGLVPLWQAEVPPDPAPRVTGYDKAAAFHQESGLIESPPAFASRVPESLVVQALEGA